MVGEMKGLRNARVYYDLLKYLEENAGMASNFPMYRQKRRYYLKRLEEWGFIRRIRAYPAIYELTELGKEALKRGFSFFIHNVKVKNGLSESGAPRAEIHVHAVKIRVPVESPGMLPPPSEMKEKGGLKGSKTYYSTRKFQNWVRKYFPDAPPFTLQITESASGYSVLIHLGERKYRVQTPDEANARILEDAIRAVTAASQFLARYRWRLSIRGIQIQDMHIALPLPHQIGKHVPRGTVSTGEKVLTPTGERPREAKIWTDGTPYPHTLEMDSMVSLADFLLAGKRIRELREILAPTVQEIYIALNQMTGTLRDLSDTINTLQVYMGAPPHNRLN